MSLAYSEAGRGSPVVMVHGCCADSRAWDRHRDAIAQNHRFIALDQRCNRTAPWPDKGEKYSAENTDRRPWRLFARPGRGAGTPGRLVVERHGSAGRCGALSGTVEKRLCL